MIDIDFSDLQKAQAFITDLENRFDDYTRLWTDFVTPLIISEISYIFETEGRGEWPPLSPQYRLWKEANYPDKTILRLEDNYIQAATSTSHPGNIARFLPKEMTWGISGGYFESAFGENYPERHELGIGVPARPVFDLVTAGGRLDENIAALGEKWAREELAEAEQKLF